MLQNKRLNKAKDFLEIYFLGIFSSALFMIAVPYLLRFYSSEDFSLIAFLIISLNFIMLLDLGMSVTVTRYVAENFKLNRDICRKVLVNYILIISLISIISIAVIFALNLIGFVKFNSTIFGEKKILALGVLVIGCKLYISLAAAYLIGAGQQKTHARVNMVFSVTKSIIPILANTKFEMAVESYFLFMAVVSILELITLGLMVVKTFPYGGSLRFDIEVWRKTKNYTYAVGYASFTWILTMQIDKIILVSAMSAEEYSRFFVMTQAGSILILTLSPFYKMIFPGLVESFNSDDKRKFKDKVNVNRLNSMNIASLFFFIVMSNREMLFKIWTGVEYYFEVELVVQIYMFGWLMLAYGTYSNQIQNIREENSQRYVGSTLSSILQIGLTLGLFYKFEGTGVLIAWFLSRFLWYWFWVVGVIFKQLNKESYTRMEYVAFGNMFTWLAAYVLLENYKNNIGDYNLILSTLLYVGIFVIYLSIGRSCVEGWVKKG